MRNNLCNQVIGGCRLEYLLGRGGMGDVYKAHHINLDIPVAVKILDNQLAGSPDIIDRFILEARATARLDSPYIVRVLQVGEENGVYYLQMELVEGESLASKLKRDGQLEIADAMLYLYQIGMGLMVAHHANILHRDIKPANILLSNKGMAKITDFGLAKCMETSSEITRSGQILGTPYYLSPEQCEGKPGDIRSDIYALGVTFFFMLAGKCPFQGENFVAVALSKLHSKPPSLRTLRPKISAKLEALAMKMIARHPEERYPHMTALLQDVCTFLPAYGIQVPPIQTGKTMAMPVVASKPATTENRKSAKVPVAPEPQVHAAPVLAASSGPADSGQVAQESDFFPTATDMNAAGKLALNATEAFKVAQLPEQAKPSRSKPLSDHKAANLPTPSPSARLHKQAEEPGDSSGEEVWETILTSETEEPQSDSVVDEQPRNEQPQEQYRPLRRLRNQIHLTTARLKALWPQKVPWPTKAKLRWPRQLTSPGEIVRRLLCKKYLVHAEKLRQQGDLTAAMTYLQEQVPTRWRCAAIEAKLQEIAQEAQGIQGKLIGLQQLQDKDAREQSLAELAALGKPIIGTLIQALGSDSWGLKASAAQVLGRMGTKATTAIPNLIQALQDDNLAVSSAVAQALSSMGPHAVPAIPALTQKLKSWNWQVRSAAARALARIGEPATPVLAQALKDKVALVREAAAYALGEMGPQSASAVPILMHTLNDRVWEVRKSTVEALGKIGPAAALSIPTPLQAMDDEDARMKSAARIALKKIRG